MEVDSEIHARRERRQELKIANLTAWRQGKPAEYQQQLLKDVKTLTLEKYISEVVVA
ncbi:13542_t:CDS:2, partial [Racocetra fulgida]